MNRLLIPIMFLVVCACSLGYAYHSHRRDASSADVRTAEDDVAAANGELTSAQGLPKVPPLVSSWTQLELLAEGCGSKLARSISTDLPAAPAGAWPGAITGPASTVGGCMKILLATIPLEVTGAQLASGGSDGSSVTVYFYVLGGA